MARILDRDRRRRLAHLLFTAPEDIFFGVEANVSGPIGPFLEHVKDHVHDLLPVQVPGEPPLSSSILAALSPELSVRQLLREVARNTLLSQSPSLEAFREAWYVMRGFDIDGLIRIGDEAARERLERPARWHLRPRFETLLAEDAPADGAPHFEDGHVHYGQMIDLQLLWAAQLSSGLKHPIGGFKGARSPQRRAASGHWNGKLQCCRSILMAWASPDASAHGACLALVKGVIAGGFRETNVDQLAEQAVKEAPRLLPSAQTILELEDALFSILAHEREGTPRLELATIYVLLKNSYFHALAQNSVLDFEKFSLRLRDQDFLYGGLGASAGLIKFISFFGRYIRQGSRDFGSVKVRVKSNLDKFRDIEHVIERAPHLNRRIVLAIKRDDIECLEDDFQRKEYCDDISKLAGLLKREGIDVTGVDLMGPEVRQEAARKQQPLLPIKAQEPRRTAEFIFDARDLLRSNGFQEAFATFHCGEYGVDSRVSLLTLIMIVSSPRFDLATDRLSHALVLHEKQPQVNTEEREIADALHLLRAAIGHGFETWPSGGAARLPGATAASLMPLVEAVAGEPSSDAFLPAFLELQEYARSWILSGAVKLELCPSSNAMIRRDLVPEIAAHPWQSLHGRPNVFVGTDDPSLTQTLPWMEHALLRTAAAG